MQREDKHRQLIMPKPEISSFTDELKLQAKEIAGAKTATGWDIPWLKTCKDAFLGDGEGRIVRGPLVGLTAVEGKTPPNCRQSVAAGIV